MACYLGKAKNPNASIKRMLEPVTVKYRRKSKNKPEEEECVENERY
jgi:hypothetical protein